MRYMRSFFCAGLAMVAMAACASMPAAAAVPIDPGVMVQPLTAKDYPAPVAVVVHEDAAVLPSMPAVEGHRGKRSSIFASSHSFADTPASVPAYRHIDPDITC